jgi:tetratricopeptide (TPR) repeat protein
VIVTQIEELNAKIKDIHFLILDPEKNIDKIVQNGLSTLGVNERSISTSTSLDETMNILQEKKPSCIACYFDPNDQEVFKILDEHKRLIPNSFERYFLAFSKTKSIFTFAQALEEEIDDYIVEPYNETKFVEKIQKLIHAKENPSEYKLLLKQAQRLIIAGDLKTASINLDMAMRLHPRPAMVFYLQAKIKIKEKENTQAIKLLINGLKFNKDHYQCLLLLHELYFKQTNFDKAYRVLKKVLENFPLSTNRMFEIFRLGITSGKLIEVQDYCKKILKEEPDNILMIKFCTAGLIVNAMSMMEKNEKVAFEILTEALRYSKSNPKVLRNIFNCYISFGLFKDAKKILPIFKQEDHNTLEFKVCNYIFEIHSTRPIDMIVAESKEKLISVQYDSNCFDTLYKRVQKEGLQEDIVLIETIGRSMSILETEA